MRYATRCRRWLGVLLLLGVALPVLAAAPSKNDIRVLIDISGSMRTNDPQNLRRPALRMLVNLMQPGTQAGVWTFAKWSNRLVPPAEIDDAWRKKAMSLSNQITSPGQFTHVERVLEDAIQDWAGEPSTHNRHLVLLTDGMVDVSKTPGESEASRQRILEVLLPRIKALGAKVHTIALSERADHELMKRLSNGTDGWYQQVESADTLQRVFLKMFEQVGNPDSVPLDDNKFTVDASVREATILLFRKPGSSAPVLLSPTGEQFTDSDLPSGVAWYRDEGYDLITLASPRKGEWSLQADVDPDNRVMIVTDLKLETSEIPAHIAVGEMIPMTANLSNKGKLVQRKAFLRLLDVRADALSLAGTDPLGLNDAGEEGDQTAGDGRYTLNYRENRPFDEVELLFSVESPTFMREKRFHLAVHEPASLEVVEQGDGFVAKVEVNQVMREGAQLSVWQADASGARRELAAEADGTAYTLLEATEGVFLSISGQTRLGNLINREIGPVFAPGMQVAAEPVAAAEQAPTEVEQVPEAAAEPAPAASPEAEPEAIEEAAEEPVEEAEEEAGWLLPALLFGGFNLLLIGGGLGVWWWMRKKRGTDDDLLVDEAEADAAPDQAEADSDSNEDGKGEAA